MKIVFSNTINVQSLINEIKSSHFMSEVDRKTKIIAGAIIGALALILVVGLLYRHFKASKDPATTADEKKGVTTDNPSKTPNADQKSEQKQPKQVNGTEDGQKEVIPQKPAETDTSKENQPTPDAEKQLNATKKTNATEKTKIVGEIIKPNQPAQKPTETLPIQTTLPTEIQQPEANNATLPSPSTIPTNKSSAQAPIVEDADEPQIDPAVQERILYLGSDGDHLQASELKQLEVQFEAYCQNAENQKSYGNTREGIIFIDLNSFGKSPKLYNPQFHAFIRHLVLNGKIHAYNPNVRTGICLYLTADAQEKNADIGTSDTAPKFFDRKKLLEMDQYTQEIEAKIPTLDQFPVGNQDIIKEILSDIREAHYKRASQNDFSEKEVSNNRLSIFDKFVSKVLDKLVELGTIHAWSASVNQTVPILKLEENDPQRSSNLLPWRDLVVITQEKEFQESNHLDKEKILSLDIQVSGTPLTPNEVNELSKLIDKLNRRIKHGPFIWKPDGFSAHSYEEVLKTLTTEGMIHSYKREFVGSSLQYKIHVKEIDSQP